MMDLSGNLTETFSLKTSWYILGALLAFVVLVSYIFNAGVDFW